MRKKILIGLLVAIGLTVGTNSTIFGLNDSTTRNSKINTTVNTCDGRDTCFCEITLDNKNFHQDFCNEGFQYFYNPKEYVQEYGYVCDWSDNDFEVLTGLFDVNGKLYYSDQCGNSVQGFKEIGDDLYYFKQDLNNPCALQGWQKIDGNIYYFDSDCKAVKGSTLINGRVCLFDDEGHYETGWQPDENDLTFSEITLDNENFHQDFCNVGFQYFYNPDEYLQEHGYVCSWTKDNFEVLTGLFVVNGNLYCSDDCGNSEQGFKEINGNLYYFNKDLNNPCALKGWQTIDGNRYYFDNEYKAAKGRKLIDGKVYLFDNQGHSETGWQYIDGERYYCTQDGELLTGWQNINCKRYFLDPGYAGAAHIGVYDNDSAGTMYFYQDGSMADGVSQIGDNKYLFTHHGNGQNAYVNTGWYTDTLTNKRYYFNANKGGKAEIGLRCFGGYTYIFDGDGVLRYQRKD